MNQIKTTSDEKTQFLATAIHEIRTPVQTIIGTLELLNETKLDKEQIEYIRQLQFSADVLLTLSNDVLDLSKMQSGKFDIECIPYSPLQKFEQVVDLICIEAHNRGLEILTNFNYDLPPVIMGDPMRTQQILLNLIKNAVKFTQFGHVNVVIDFDKEKQILFFEVQDSGIGIPEDKQKQIFADYYQVDASTTRRFGGTGLGLSICKNLVNLMKGNLNVKTNPSGGSIFYFSIPYTLPSIDEFEQYKNTSDYTQNYQTALAISKEQKNQRILLVDDYPLSLESIGNKLNYLGFIHIDNALNGEQALQMLKDAKTNNQPYDFALIDMIMNGMDGWRLAAEINADKTINETKLFLMVPEGQMGGEAKMKMLDWFNGYLYKPIKRIKLYELLCEPQVEPIDLEVIDTDTTEVENTNNDTIDDKDIAKGLQVLIAEDHPINRKLITTFLKQFGAEVFEAENGKEAISIIQDNQNIDIVFMDIQMPILNGIEATEKLRENSYQGIIIACTANTDTEDFDTYQKVGMNDILVKPFKKKDVKELFQKWNSVMKLSAAEITMRKNHNTEIKKEPSGSVWNKIDMLDTVGGDLFLATQLIDQFIMQTRVFLIKAKEASYQYNFQGLARIAHSLKGSAGTISAEKLFSAAKELEQAAKDNQYDNSRALINQFSVLFTKFIEEVNIAKKEWQETK